MRNWKKIFTLALLFLVSTITFFACGSKTDYSKMSISIEAVGLDSEDNSITYNQQTNNMFTLKVTVVNAGSASTNVQYEIVDKGLITYSSHSKSGSTTSYVFKVDPSESAISTLTNIRFTTEEGNKSRDFQVKVHIPLARITLHRDTIPVVKGKEINLDNLNNFFDYVPSNTNQRGVYYGIKNVVDAQEEDIKSITDYLEEHENKIFISEESSVQSFTLTIKSRYDSYLIGAPVEEEVLVVVLDKVSAEEFSLQQGYLETSNDSEDEDSDSNSDYPLLTQDDNGKYKLTLVNNNDKFFNYREVIVDVLLGGSALSDVQFSYQKPILTPGNEPSTEEVSGRLYSVYIQDLVYNGKVAVLGEDGCIQLLDSERETEFISNNLINAKPRNEDIDTFLISQATTSTGTCQIVFLIDFYGFEGMYEPIKIPVEVSIVTFPSELRLYNPSIKLDDLTSENAYDFDSFILEDNDLVIYNNGAGTFFRVAVWGDSSFINGQPITIEIDNPNISIMRDNVYIVDGGQTIRDCNSGDLLKIVKNGELTGEIVLKLTSSVYTELTKEIRVRYLNDNTTLSAGGSNVILLDPEFFTPNQTDPNSQVHIFDNLVFVTGIPTLESGEYDYSTMKVEIENGDNNPYLELEVDEESDGPKGYFKATNNWILLVKNKIGATNIVVTTPNGIKLSLKLYIQYPFYDATEFFKMQLVNFENFVDKDNYGYQFSASDTRGENVTSTKLLVGEQYSYYYLLGEQQYYDLTGIMNVNSPYNPMPNCIEIDVENRTIKVKDYTSSVFNLIFSFTNAVKNEQNTYTNYYINIEITLERVVETITTKQHSITLYDLKTLGNANVKIGNNQKETYYQKYGFKNITLDVYPINATTDYQIVWRVGDTSGALFEQIASNNPNEMIFTYGNSIIPTVIRLIVSDNRATVTISVTNISGNEFDFSVYPYLTQTFVTSNGEEVVHPLTIPIDVHVVKAGSVNAINTPNLYNGRISFDIRTMLDKDNNGIYDGNNTAQIEFELIKENPQLEILNKDVWVYSPSTDVSFTINEDNTITIRYSKSSGQHKLYPVYTIYIVANASTKDALFTTNDVYANISSCYDVVLPIEVRVANGEAIPYEIDTEEELKLIGSNAVSMSANYV